MSAIFVKNKGSKQIGEKTLKAPFHYPEYFPPSPHREVCKVWRQYNCDIHVVMKQTDYLRLPGLRIEKRREKELFTLP